MGHGLVGFWVRAGFGDEDVAVREDIQPARALQVAREFSSETTFLGAHVVPAEYAQDRPGYLDLLVGPMLEAAAPYARWIDVVCEARRTAS